MFFVIDCLRKFVPSCSTERQDNILLKKTVKTAQNIPKDKPLDFLEEKFTFTSIGPFCERILVSRKSNIQINFSSQFCPNLRFFGIFGDSFVQNNS